MSYLQRVAFATRGRKQVDPGTEPWNSVVEATGLPKASPGVVGTTPVEDYYTA
jgi:hypothetical protein